jgi:putative N6-adenine-specific DNA methylase
LADLQNYIAKTLHGLEPALSAELETLGASNIQIGTRNVHFSGDTALMYRANYELRTALRILVPVGEFVVNNEKALYEAVRSIKWNQYMGVSDTLAVEAVVRSDIFRHSQYVGLLTKDAIVDQFRDAYNRRPDVNVNAPTLRINIHIQDNKCHLSLDASGDSLHRRNYRKDSVDAPLNEVLAAGMILLSGWNCATDFVDPMCGSGTLAIEAAMMATHTPIQIKREGFGFFKWPDFNEKLWKKVKQEADEKVQNFENQIYASDKDPRARNATALNLMASGMENHVRLERQNFEKLVAPSATGTLITNPPYDERLKMEDIVSFYKSIGDRFKQDWAGWNAWLISSNRDALKHIGLRPSKKYTLFNGSLECSFQKFEMYAGTKKD